MNECIDYVNDPLKGIRRVICAAIKDGNGAIVCGARHYDKLMHHQLNNCKQWNKFEVEQGFIDQWGNFLTRENAFLVATESNQIIKRCGGDHKKLFSENLY